jgi:hypothetical protein
MTQKEWSHGVTPLPCVLGYRADAWWELFFMNEGRCDDGNYRSISNMVWTYLFFLPPLFCNREGLYLFLEEDRSRHLEDYEIVVVSES